jgi:hypothetical protein
MATDLGGEQSQESNYNIAMDFDSGYWQVALVEISREKTALFTPSGQKQWRVMPMGFINAHAFFCSIVDQLKREWNALAAKKGIRVQLEVMMKGSKPWTDLEVIVDNLMLHLESVEMLLMAYLPIWR